MGARSVEYLADRLEIDDLLTRYATALDAGDWDRWASCFTPDAFLDYSAVGGIKGRLPEVRDWLARVMKMFPVRQHIVANRSVTIEGDTATSLSYVFNPMGVGEPGGAIQLFFEGAAYRDRLVRTADGWRIAERVEEACYSTRLQRLLAPPA